MSGTWAKTDLLDVGPPLDSENAKLSIDTKKLNSTAETLKHENVRLTGENKTLSTMSKYAENRISVLETALDPGSAPAQKADALKRLALSQAIAGKGREASQLIVEAERVSSSAAGAAAVRPDRAPRNVSPENQARAGRSQQKERLIRAGENLAALKGSERRYVCEHNYYVIGASEKIEEAQSEIDRRWRKVYPNAVAGVPQPNLGLTPIAFDYFLTCEEARRLAADIQARYKSGPMVRQWYTELSCPPCPTPAAVPRP